jgi:branched-subunit amino acid ABC-type transport system permease component
MAKPRIGIIVGSKATLVVDTGLGPRNGQAVLREVGKVSSNTDLFIVATHFHSEHTLGESAFPANAKVIRARGLQKDIDEIEVNPTGLVLIPPLTDLPPLKIGGVAINFQFLWIVGLSLLLIVLLDRFFKTTRTGKAMRACAINREAAALQGIPVSRMLALSFALSAALGAIAGVLITPTQYTAFNVGVPFAISGFIAAIVGGFGHPLGAFMGGIMLGLAQSIAIVAFGAGLKNVAALSVLLLFLFIRPGGILGEAK